VPTKSTHVARLAGSLFGIVLMTGTAVAGCTANSGAKSSSPTTAPPIAHHFTFNAANFVDPTLSTNEYQPLVPGTQWVRTGTTEVGSRKVPHSVISTITDVMRTIDGVKVVAMLDQSTDSGEISQVGFDWYALDKDRNVWIMGGYTEDYQGGEFTQVEDGWLGAASGGNPGVLVPGLVRGHTPRWFIGAADKTSLGSVAEPAKIGVTKCVAFGCFHNIRAVREGEYKAIDNEIKNYAPGVGVVYNEPRLASLHQDRFELVNLVRLSPAGLAEASQVVLNLEKHARTALADVYGSVPLSKRVP
jgi:hypothetical protein